MVDLHCHILPGLDDGPDTMEESIAMAESARAFALLAGRPTVGFEDVKAVASPVLNHRLVLNYKAKFDSVDSTSLIARLLSQIDETGIKLPRDVEIEK